MEKSAKSKFRFTKPEKSWIMYDWANSIYATNIMAAIFPILYTAVADDVGSKWYGVGVSVASLVIAVLAPFLGTLGDFKGMKKKLFSFFLVLGVVFTALIAVAIVTSDWRIMLLGYILSRVGFSGSCLFYDSFLTDVTTDERMDKVSAWGYAMGYIGGSTIPFLISIGVLLLTDYSQFGQIFSILIVSVWWIVFSIPMLKNVHQVHYVERPEGTNVAKAGWKNFLSTARAILTNPGLLIFVLAYFFYIDGVDTVISVSTNYGSTLGLGSTGMILALVVTQVVAVPFSILFSRLSEKVGSVKMIIVAVAVYVGICCVGFCMGSMVEPYQMEYADTVRVSAEANAPAFASAADKGVWEDVVSDLTETGRESLYAETAAERVANFHEGSDSVFGGVLTRLNDPENVVYVFENDEDRKAAAAAVELIWADCEPLAADAGKLDGYVDATGTASLLFWVLATLVGTVQGGIQALSRSYFGKLIPAERSNEFFGFFDVFGKFAAVVGPLLYSLGYMISGRASVGILSLILLFVCGACLLIFGGKKIAETERIARSAE